MAWFQNDLIKQVKRQFKMWIQVQRMDLATNRFRNGLAQSISPSDQFPLSP